LDFFIVYNAVSLVCHEAVKNAKIVRSTEGYNGYE